MKYNLRRKEVISTQNQAGWTQIMLLEKNIRFKNSIYEEIEQIAGKNNIITDIEGIYAYAYDCAHLDFKGDKPCMVVFPENTQTVSEIMKIANRYNIPVIARGAGTNHAGGCAPVDGGIILHFSKMNKIIELNAQNLTCRVQPGVVIADLQREAEKSGLFYPPDPSNLAVSTIGGGIALSSGGPRAFKYGTVKDYVLDLEVVLADGKIIHTGSSTPKNVTGYNLTQLFVGAEGTLGIVTEAVLKLIPKPECTNVLLAYFNRLDDAVNAVSSIINNHLTPSVVDLLDKKTLQTIEQFFPSGLLCDKEAVLLIEVDGDAASIEHQQEKIINECKKFNSEYIECAKNEEHKKRIWTARRASFGACAKMAPNVITEDVVVPRDKIYELAKGIEKIAEKYSIITMIMGHIGDGNIHPNFALDLRDENQRKNFTKAKKELFELALSLGGTLSGEHGIGCQKAEFLPDALGEDVLAIMKSIKQLFDPKNILNPHKMM